jgi:hypothetical protein
MNTYNQNYISHIPLNSTCLDGLSVSVGKPVIIYCEIEQFGIIVLILSIKVIPRAYANGSFLLEFYFLIELVRNVFANIRMFAITCKTLSCMSCGFEVENRMAWKPTRISE